MKKISTANMLNGAYLSLIWWFLIVTYSGFIATGLEKNWLMSFGNGILNGTIVFLLIILIRKLNGHKT